MYRNIPKLKTLPILVKRFKIGWIRFWFPSTDFTQAPSRRFNRLLVKQQYFYARRDSGRVHQTRGNDQKRVRPIRPQFSSQTVRLTETPSKYSKSSIHPHPIKILSSSKAIQQTFKFQTVLSILKPLAPRIPIGILSAHGRASSPFRFLLFTFSCYI